MTPSRTTSAAAADNPSTTTRRTSTSVPGAVRRLEQFGLPLLLVILFIVFTANPVSGPTFRSSANINLLLGNQAVTALVALAMVVPLICGYFDLSVSAIAGVSNITVAAAMSTYHLPVWAALLAGLIVGALIGFINGLLVAKVRLNGFVVTLGTYTALIGAITWYTKGQLITSGIPPSFGHWSAQSLLGVPRPFLILIAIAVIVWYIVTQTPFGRRLEAIGSNESAARLVGIGTTRAVWTSFVISGVLAGAAGALQTSRGGAGDPSVATAYLFPAFTAVFLGATMLKPGKYNVWGTVIGVFFVAISVSGLTLLGADVWVQPVFNGLALIAAVALSTLIARSRQAGAAKKQHARVDAERSSPQTSRSAQT
ncbi:ABC transporter permease [Subtercola frigoramans]|uniref:Ribose transport system permease protein n=1 Tax=Subtercola frigoramans TaxID=120298 RepID=A0ABS2L6Z0_9MICO|nr:ABC transporter permease [Subtercola frigoramans]MBM7472872.1 ribose transport system permease protein [Subtercola frigoramans]